MKSACLFTIVYTTYARLIVCLEPETFLNRVSCPHKCRYLSSVNYLRSLDGRGTPSKRLYPRPLPVITTTAFTAVDIAFDPLPSAMTEQFSCLEDLEMLLDSLPDEMCYLSKNHVGSSRNDHCWTGTVLGRYGTDDMYITLGQKNTLYSNIPWNHSVVDTLGTW